MTIDLLLDCDTGVDDALAILYAAGEGARLRACTVTHGNVPVEIGTRNTLTVLDLLGLVDVPVYAGAARPMAQPLETSELVHGRDGLGDAGVVASTRSPAGDLAAVEIVRLARQAPGELTLVAVGPLTNIGLALLLEPRLPQLVRRIVVMGGAVGVAGNSSQLAEANIWHDPEAAQLVLDAAWDVVLVGLETTMRSPMPEEVLRRIEAGTDPRARFVWAIIQGYLAFYEASLGRRLLRPPRRDRHRPGHRPRAGHVPQRGGFRGDRSGPHSWHRGRGSAGVPAGAHRPDGSRGDQDRRPVRHRHVLPADAGLTGRLTRGCAAG